MTLLLVLGGAGAPEAVFETRLPARRLPDRQLTAFVFSGAGALLGTWTDFTNDVRFSYRNETEQESIDFELPRHLGAADETNDAGTLGTMVLGNRVDLYVTSWRTLGGMQVDVGIGGGREGVTAASFGRLLWQGTIVAIGRRPDGYRVTATGGTPLTAGAGATHYLSEGMFSDYELEVSAYETGKTYTGWVNLPADVYDIDAIKIGDTCRVTPAAVLNPAVAGASRYLPYEEQALTVASCEWSLHELRINFDTPVPDLVLQQIAKLMDVATIPGNATTAQIQTNVMAAIAAVIGLASYTPDAESSAYTGLDNAQGGTPYAAVADVNALRVAYENLRAAVEDLRDKLT